MIVNDSNDKDDDFDEVDDLVSEVQEGEDSGSLPPVLWQDQSLQISKKRPASGDILQSYINEINKYELLTIDEEKALTQALKETGDIEVAKKLVLANLRLVVKIAMEYRYAYANVMDLIQEGNLGLMKGVSKYDPDKGAKLSYYASWWIRSYILKFILDNFRLVKIGTTNEQKKLFYNLLREKNRLLSLGISPDTKSLADNLGVSEKSVTLMEQRLGPYGGELSLDRPLNQDEGQGGGTLETILLTENLDQNIDDELANKESLFILENRLQSFLSALNERDCHIFRERLLNEAPRSLQSLADEYGVSRERIRQIEERLLKNLKVYMSEFLG